MDVAIGLPNAVPGTSGEQLTEWARRAEARGFSSLGTIDRVAYPNLEPLASLAAAAAVTERIGLATTVLLGPLRVNPVALAKQVASVHKISGGRMTLGIGLGGREDDYEVSGVEHRGPRGRDSTRCWSGWRGLGGRRDGPGHEAAAGAGRRRRRGLVQTRRPLRRRLDRRRGRRRSSSPSGGSRFEAAWSEAGRDGAAAERRPRLLLARRSRRGGRAGVPRRLLRLARRGDRRLIADCAAKTPETVQQYISAFEAVGCQELFLFPSSSDPQQVDLLADALGM